MKFIEVLVEVLMLVFSHKTAFKEVDLCFNTNQVKHFLTLLGPGFFVFFMSRRGRLGPSTLEANNF